MSTRIIIIDDDPDTESVVSQTAPAGAEVSRFDDVRKGLKVAYKQPPSLIILSADLPDGYKACRRLKKEPKLVTVPVVLLSGEATREQFEQHAKLSARADLYLHKPVDGAVLADAWDSLLGASGAEEAEPPPLPDFEAPAPPPPLDEEQSAEQTIEQLRSELRTLRSERDELRIELGKLSDRLHNVKQSHRRAEEGFEHELTTLRKQLEAAQASGGASDMSAEFRRLKHLYDDLLEAMEVIEESLAMPRELLDRHRELAGARPAATADEPIEDEPIEDEPIEDEPSDEELLDDFEEASSLGFAPE